MAVNYNAEPILTVNGLKQYFKVSNTFTVKAVDNVSFKIYPGETYGPGAWHACQIFIWLYYL